MPFRNRGLHKTGQRESCKKHCVEPHQKDHQAINAVSWKRQAWTSLWHQRDILFGHPLSGYLYLRHHNDNNYHCVSYFPKLPLTVAGSYKALM